MCEGGVKVDLEYRDALKEKLERELAVHLDLFFQAVRSCGFDDDYRPNPRSPKALGELFFRKLKLVGRGTSTNFANRKRFLSHPNTTPDAKRLIGRLDSYLKAAKFYSTYVDTELDPDGRYSCSYIQSGTQESPGRLSSSSTPWETGGNLQNQPHSAYPLFVVEPGYCFIYFDLEQAEARVVGWEANIPSWISDFEKARIEGGYDCHRALCSAMWNIPYADTPSEDIDADGNHTKRYIAKRCRHGLNYRMYFVKLAEVTGLSITAAHEAYTRYHKITPELKKWWDDLTIEVKRTKILHNALGRRWVLTEPMSESTLESIVAFKPQSTIGDKVVQVIYQSEDDDEWPHDARIAMNIHDALIGIAPIAKADTCLRIMKKYAEQPIYIKNREPLIIPASLKKTTNATAFRTTPNGDIEFYEHEQGYHRWSSLAKVAMRELSIEE
jgi:DNA polymerase I-like protein with 3'-5' exonuclease and polymerase domains